MGHQKSPEWFEWALAQPRRSHFTDSAGTRVHYASWNAGEVDKPGLLFAHGFLGHSQWWDFIAPFFIEKFRVFALDFSGMGESGHRATYTHDCFVGDLAAVLKAMQTTHGAASTVIGHSFGGTRLLQACCDIPALIAHAIVMDSFAAFRGEQMPASNHGPAPKPYLDEATALSRFRLLPPQDCEPYLLDHIARNSLRRVDGGWTWRFDPMLRELRPRELDAEQLRGIDVRVDYVHAEASRVVSAERALKITASIPLGRGPVTIPRAGHHLMLDQPLALVAVLRALLATA